MASVSSLRSFDGTKAVWGYLFVFALGYTVSELQRFYSASKRPNESKDAPVVAEPVIRQTQEIQEPEQGGNDHPASQPNEDTPEAVQGRIVESRDEAQEEPTPNWADYDDWGQTIPLRSQENTDDSLNPWGVDVHPSESQHPQPSNPWPDVSTETNGGWRNVAPSRSGKAKEHIIPTQIKSKGKRRAPEKSGRPGPKRDGDLCPLCFRPFGTGFALEEHIRQVHPSGPPAQRGTNTAGATCEICHASLASASEVRKHTTSEHSWSYLCTAHLTRFRDAYQALDHYRDAHQAHNVTFDSIEAFLGNVKPEPLQQSSVDPRPAQSQALQGAISEDSPAFSPAEAQEETYVEPSVAQPNAAAVLDTPLAGQDYNAESPPDSSNPAENDIGVTGNPTGWAPIEPATTPLMCMICRQVFKDHPRLAQHALYPCTRFLAPGQKTFYDAAPAISIPGDASTSEDVFEDTAVSTVVTGPEAAAHELADVDKFDPANALASSEIVDAPSSSSSEDLEGSEGQVLTPEESTDDDDVRVLSPNPTGTSYYAESIQGQGTFLEGPLDGMTPDALQRAEFVSSNRWNTGGTAAAKRTHPPPHLRSHPDFAPRQRAGGTDHVPYNPRQRWVDPTFAANVDGGIETQIPSFGLPARGTEFHPFGPPSAEGQAKSSTIETSPRSKAQTPKLGVPQGNPSSAWSKPLSVPSHATPTSHNHSMSTGKDVSTLSNQHYRQKPGSIPSNIPAPGRTLKDIAQARAESKSTAKRSRGKKLALQPVFDSGWQTLPVQQSTKSRGGKTPSYDSWGASSETQSEDNGDYGGW